MLFPWIMKREIPVEVALITIQVILKHFSYVNNINTYEGGTHLQGFRTGLTRSLKKYADASGMLDKLKFDISGDDFREGLTAIISVKVAEPQFDKLKLNLEISCISCKSGGK
jgi:DNA gyrase subunit B